MFVPKTHFGNPEKKNKKFNIKTKTFFFLRR